jgi:hypothetical protein
LRVDRLRTARVRRPERRPWVAPINRACAVPETQSGVADDPKGVYLSPGEAGRLDVRSVDKRVMRTARFWVNGSAAYRGLVVSSVKNSTPAMVLEEDPSKPSVNTSVTFA